MLPAGPRLPLLSGTSSTLLYCWFLVFFSLNAAIPSILAPVADRFYPSLGLGGAPGGASTHPHGSYVPSRRARERRKAVSAEPSWRGEKSLGNCSPGPGNPKLRHGSGPWCLQLRWQQPPGPGVSPALQEPRYVGASLDRSLPGPLSLLPLIALGASSSQGGRSARWLSQQTPAHPAALPCGIPGIAEGPPSRKPF